MLSLEGLTIFLLALLPGITARVIARRYLPETREPSALEETAAALQDALLIHIGGLILALLYIAGWQRWHGSAHLDLLVAHGPKAYFQSYPVPSLIGVLAYLVYLAVASVVVGALNLLHRFVELCVWFLWHVPLVRRLVPKEVLYREPVWYRAFRTGRPVGRPYVYVRVRLKSGDIYRGTLKSYPLSKDDAASKDFLLSDGEYLPAGDETRLELLNSKVLPGFGGILLNSKDVDAIELIYAEETP